MGLYVSMKNPLVWDWLKSHPGVLRKRGSQIKLENQERRKVAWEWIYNHNLRNWGLEINTMGWINFGVDFFIPVNHPGSRDLIGWILTIGGDRTRLLQMSFKLLNQSGDSEGGLSYRVSAVYGWNKKGGGWSEQWFRGWEQFLLLQRALAPFWVPTWQLTTTCNRSSRHPVPFYGIRQHRTHVVHVHMYRQNYTHKWKWRHLLKMKSSHTTSRSRNARDVKLPC